MGSRVSGSMPMATVSLSPCLVPPVEPPPPQADRTRAAASRTRSLLLMSTPSGDGSSIGSGSMATLLEIEGLRTHFHTRAGVVRAVDGVDLDVAAGQTLGVVGESGCGKSVTALSIMGLIDPPGRIEPGSRIMFDGQDLVHLDEDELRDIRGNQISMVFQEPMTSLNPV